ALPQVTSASVKPRLAGRQPSLPRWGAPGDDRTRHECVGQARIPLTLGVPDRVMDPRRCVMSLSALAPDTRSPISAPEAVGPVARLVPGARPAPAAADPLALLDAGLTVPVTSGGRVEYANFDYA